MVLPTRPPEESSSGQTPAPDPQAQGPPDSTPAGGRSKIPPSPAQSLEANPAQSHSSSQPSYLERLLASGLIGRDLLQPVIRCWQSTSAEPTTTGPDLKAAAERLLSNDEPGERLGQRLVAAGLLTAWQHQRLAHGFHQGFFLGKYKLLDRLGSGGMGEVFLGEHPQLRRLVAIKVLPEALVDSPEHLRRFYRESRAMASLQHPNIIQAFDVDRDGRVHYLVMEYVPGLDLQRLVRQGGVLQPVVGVDYLRQAALGLSHAHSRGLIHRDIKPSNLFVSRQGEIKILDMGIARVIDQDDEPILTGSHQMLGTLDYQAPEQWTDANSVDARADLYSLGCTMCFLLVGQPPFPMGNASQRQLQHETADPPKLDRLRKDIPEDLAEIAGRLLAKRPADRFASAAELARVLEGWLLGQSSVPEIPLPPAPLDAEPARTGWGSTDLGAAVLSHPSQTPDGLPVNWTGPIRLETKPSHDPPSMAEAISQHPATRLSRPDLAGTDCSGPDRSEPDFSETDSSATGLSDLAEAGSPKAGSPEAEQFVTEELSASRAADPIGQGVASRPAGQWRVEDLGSEDLSLPDFPSEATVVGPGAIGPGAIGPGAIGPGVVGSVWTVRPLDESALALLRDLVEQRLLTSFQADILAGRRSDILHVRGYQLLDRIANGRLAGVYRGRHVIWQIPVCLKLVWFSPDSRQAAKQYAEFQSEARIASQVDHPNVVRTYDFGRDENLCFVTFENLLGESLREALQPFSGLNWELGPQDETIGESPHLARSRWQKLGMICRAVLGAASGLVHLHELGIAHGQLTPDNIWVGDEGGAKLLDFAGARDSFRFLDENRRVAEATLAGDICSLGMVLSWALTGRSANLDSQLPLRALDPAIPAELERLCLQMRSAKPQHRPDASTVAEQLVAILEAGFTATDPAGDHSPHP